MTPNPILKRLGLSDDARVAIVHLDDVGMCHASVEAYKQVLDAGIVSSASVMQPCAWFPATATFCRTRPNVDMGVHITLTSEWDNYRWGPTSTRMVTSGLMDAEGYFYRSSGEAQTHGDATAVRIELFEQVQQALDAGIDVTHLDTHMGSIMHLKFIPAYIEAAQHFRVPALFLRLTEEQLRGNWMFQDDAAVQMALTQIAYLEGQGFPLIDYTDDMPLNSHFGADRVELAKRKFAAFKPGITHIMLHASVDTPELRAIAPDWQARVGDLATFTNPELRRFIEQEGIQLLEYRALRDLMRGGNGQSA